MDHCLLNLYLLYTFRPRRHGIIKLAIALINLHHLPQKKSSFKLSMKVQKHTHTILYASCIRNTYHPRTNQINTQNL